MRLFIAIDFNELKDHFLEIQSRLPRNAKVSLAKSFHITLKFLGEVQPDKFEGAIMRLKSVKFKRFYVFLNGIGTFPTERGIRVVWVGINPEDDILELQKSIDEALNPLFKKEKDFKSHITLARVKYPEDKKHFVEKLRNIKIKSEKIEVNDFKLIKSSLTTKGPIYEDVAIFSFNQ